MGFGVGPYRYASVLRAFFSHSLAPILRVVNRSRRYSRGNPSNGARFRLLFILLGPGNTGGSQKYT